MSESFAYIDLKKIQPNRLNPRLEFRKKALDELSDSIKESGMLQPIIIRPVGNEYEVVVGERRYRASQQAHLDKVPVIIRDYTDDEVIELNLIENIQRENLSAVEKANSCIQLKKRFPEKYPVWEAIAQKIGVGPDTVQEWVRTLSLPDEIRSKIAPREIRRVPEGKIDYQTALHVVEKIKEKPKQIEVVEKLAEQRIPQRLAKKIIQEIVKEPKKPVEQVIAEIAEAPPRLLFIPDHADSIRIGKKQQTSRRGLDPKIKVGTKIEAYTTFAELKIVNIERKRLGDFTDEDAKREGDYTLEGFKGDWKKWHGEWDPNDYVYVVQFVLEKITA
jgi:ParB family chromosome partitioning protein